MTRWKAGDGVRVIDLTGLKLPKGKKPPFALGDILVVVKASADHSKLVVRKEQATDHHTGWFAASRFEKL